jgi:hypothetical protein
VSEWKFGEKMEAFRGNVKGDLIELGFGWERKE